MVDSGQRQGRLWAEQWAVDASVKAESVEGRLRQVLAARRPDARAQATAETVQRLVHRARQATVRHRRRRALLDYWRGTTAGEANRCLHAAEILLLDLLPDEEIDAVAPDILSRAWELLPRDDPRRLALESVHEAHAVTKRAQLRNTLSLVYESADLWFVRARGFRNVLYISAALIGVLMCGLTIAVSLDPASLPFCFVPDGWDGAEQVCPSGRPAPSGTDVLILAGLGLLGGALAAAFSLRNLRGTSLPYDIPVALALLKVPSGSLTAVAGVLLLGGGFVPGLSALETQRQILAYALLFGYAQQAATRLVDERAQQILSYALVLGQAQEIASRLVQDHSSRPSGTTARGPGPANGSRAASRGAGGGASVSTT